MPVALHVSSGQGGKTTTSTVTQITEFTQNSAQLYVENTLKQSQLTKRLFK